MSHRGKLVPKLIVQLNGGLGNQMFQYACARSLAIRHGVQLVLDDWSGFVRDFQYKRKYELGGLPIKGRMVKACEIWPIWLYRLSHRFRHSKPKLLEEYCYGRFINETDFAWQSILSEVSLTGSTWINGYWQSPRYFLEHTFHIRAELMPPPAQQPHFVEMARLMRDSESIALGIRLYEESHDPNAHAGDRQLKSSYKICSAITQMSAERPQARYFVFCTHRSPILHELNLPIDTVYITHDDGYLGTLERLWLLTQCRHHIFTVSSYYWWGAWLSMGVRGSESQTIIAADNFMNRDGICPEWKTF